MQPSFVLKDRSNQELLDGAKHLVGRQRKVTAHLIAHLAEIDARDLHLAERFPTLTKYCIGALGLSEDEAYRRAYAAELARKYPVILNLLLNGSIHLTTLRLIGPCLTAKNHKRVLEAARGKSKTQLEHLAAMVRPRADVPTVLRKLPEPSSEPEDVSPEDALFASGESVAAGAAGGVLGAEGMEDNAKTETSGDTLPVGMDDPGGFVTPPPLTKSRMRPLSPERYSLQLTIDRETYDALRELQDLLRHQVPNGDLIRIVKDSILERREQVKRQKFGKAKRPRKTREQENWIPSGGPAEQQPGKAMAQQASGSHPAEKQANSRHVPLEVRRQVWERDQGRCAFVSHHGRRCLERQWLEFHHIHAYALGGPATVENIALFCRAHNAYEGVRVFGERAKELTRPGASG